MCFPLTKAEHDHIENVIVSSPEVLVAAAVRYKDRRIVFKERPARHGDVLHLTSEEPECGFVTSHGRFVDRIEAGKIAKSMNQGFPRPGASNPTGSLFSEDLWHNEKVEGPFATEDYKAEVLITYSYLKLDFLTENL